MRRDGGPRTSELRAAGCSTATTWSSSGPARATRATASTRRSPRSGRRSTSCWRPASRSSRVPGPPGALRPARDRPCLQGHRLPGHPVPGRPIDGREERVGFYNTFVGRAGDDGAAGRGAASRPTRRPATSTSSPGRTSAACSSTPSRSSPRTASRCCATWSLELLGVEAGPRGRGCVVVDHYDSYTWNLVHLVAAVTGELPTVVEHDAGRARATSRRTPTSCSRPGPGTRREPSRLRRSAGRSCSSSACRCSASAWACRPGRGVRRHGGARSSRPTARWPR